MILFFFFKKRGFKAKKSTMNPQCKFLKSNTGQYTKFWRLRTITNNWKSRTNAILNNFYHFIVRFTNIHISTQNFSQISHFYNNTHSSKFFIFKCQNPSAFCKEFYFDNRPRMSCGEISLSSPSTINKRTEFKQGRGNVLMIGLSSF